MGKFFTWVKEDGDSLAIGGIDFDEWCTATIKQDQLMNEPNLRAAFNLFDKDGGGSIDPTELRSIVRGLFCLAGIEVIECILDVRCQVGSGDKSVNLSFV